MELIEPKYIKILELLPKSTSKLSQSLNITNMPMNRRLNVLLNERFITRKKKGNEYINTITPKGKEFLKLLKR